MIDQGAAGSGAPEIESRSLPFREDMRFQIRSWRIRGVAWGGLAIILVAAVLGLFSVGPLSNVALVSADGRLGVETQRFLRDGAVEPISIRAEVIAAGEFEVILDTAFEATFDIEAMQPDPLRAFADGSGLHVFFMASPSGSSVVELRVRPTDWGMSRSTIGVTGVGSVEMAVLIFP